MRPKIFIRGQREVKCINNVVRHFTVGMYPELEVPLAIYLVNLVASPQRASKEIQPASTPSSTSSTILERLPWPSSKSLFAKEQISNRDMASLPSKGRRRTVK
ncbi:hypothetical protein ABEB36_000705 [Hypothenemus hampei]|uniref:Uncharacterized protein n=1 Tax=Hypothenemus hampei TaxID=57062 RepID=A0ABD1FFF1_HYPHA